VVERLFALFSPPDQIEVATLMIDVAILAGPILRASMEAEIGRNPLA